MEPAPTPFGVNEMRLNARQCLVTAVIILLVAVAIPRVWKKYEHFTPSADYRIPYVLSKDYWLYGRRLDDATLPSQIVVLGDSVVWGEYVRPDGTLTHFLNQQPGQSNRFINGGVNGLFPLAMEGLVDHYGGAIHNRKVIVHCNVLWMTSPKADLSTDKEERFNHSRLVPQFNPTIPCYRADAHERLSAAIERNSEFFSWTSHLQIAYYDQRSPAQWTLEDDGGDPPKYPNSWRNPFSPLNAGIPSEPSNDPQRGSASQRHKPWTTGGAGPTHFEWVTLDASLQWRAFQRTINLLRSRGNDVLVIFGPFNEHMIAQDQRQTFVGLRDGVVAWLTANHIGVAAPEVLPTDLYADASHPLTQGYDLLAERLYQNESFKKWLANGQPLTVR